MRATERVERGHCEASTSGYGYPRSADDVCWADTAHEEEPSCPEHGGWPLPETGVEHDDWCDSFVACYPCEFLGAIRRGVTVRA